MPLQSIELLLEPGCASWVRRLWADLADAGLPSQAHHRDPSNAPHVTLLTSPHLDRHLLARSASSLAPRLPAPMTITGPVILGAGHDVLALGLRAPSGLRAEALALRREAAMPDPDDWQPHVTLARRLGPDQVRAALDVLAQATPRPHVLAGTVRHWDPATRSTTALA